MKIERSILGNALAIFVITYLLTQMMHELAHALTALIHGAAPILYHNHVNYEVDVDSHKRIVIAAAGPLYSFLQAIVSFFIARRINNSSVARLFWTWMTLWGYIGFFGYVFMTPFFKYGDTGFVAEQLNVPGIARLMIGAIGISAFFFISTFSFKNFASLWRGGDKRAFFNNVIFLPLIGGVTLNTLLNLPVPTFLSLLAPLCMPWCVMMVYGKLMSRKDLAPYVSEGVDDLSSLSKPLLLALMAIIALNQVLVSGIRL